MTKYKIWIRVCSDYRLLYEFESSNQEETERGGSDRVVGGVSVREQGR